MSDWKTRGQQAAGDWKSRGAAASGSSTPNSANVDQAMPEFVSTGDRAIAKNFSNSPESALAFYRQQYPDAEFALMDGEVVGKKKGDVKWGQIDPSLKSYFSMKTLTNPLETLKEVGRDIGDVGYDLAAGATQGAATTAGFLSPVPGGAMLAGAGSGAALEAGRQAAGQAFGIPQEVSGKDTAIAGGLGALNPLLFGVNKMPGVANKAASIFGKEGLFNMTAQQEAKSGGLFKKGIDYAGPKAVKFATGIGEDVQAAYRNNKQYLQDIAKRDGQFGLVDDLSNKVQRTLGEHQTKLGKKVGDAIDTAAGPVDISKAKQVFADRLTFLKSKPYITNAEQAEINSLENYYTKYFGLAEPYSTYSKVDGVPSNSRAVSIFGQTGKEVGPVGSSPAFDMTKNTFTELPDKIQGQRAFDLQHKLKQAAAFETNMTPETLSAKGSARGAYHNINQSLDDATSGLSQEAKDNYSMFKVVGDEVEKGFNTPQKTYNSVTNLDKNAKMSLVSRLKGLSDDGVLDVSNDVDNIRALNAYHGMNAGNLIQERAVPLNTGLATALGSLGSLIGYKTGAGFTGAAVGGGAGVAAAKGLATKKAARGMSAIGDVVDQFTPVNYLTNPAYYMGNNPWSTPPKKKSEP
jgi:hypothetical protein